MHVPKPTGRPPGAAGQAVPSWSRPEKNSSAFWSSSAARRTGPRPARPGTTASPRPGAPPPARTWSRARGSGTVRVEPQLRRPAGGRIRPVEHQLQDEDRSEDSEVVELEAVGRVRCEKRPLLLREQLPDGTLVVTADPRSAFGGTPLARPSTRSRRASRRPRRRSPVTSAARRAARSARPGGASRPSRRPCAGPAGPARRPRSFSAGRACRRRTPGGSGRRADRCRAPRSPSVVGLRNRQLQLDAVGVGD